MFLSSTLLKFMFKSVNSTVLIQVYFKILSLKVRKYSALNRQEVLKKILK